MLGFTRHLEADRVGHVEVKLSGLALGDEQVAVQQADALAFALDRQRSLERRRQPQADAGRVRRDALRDKAGGVAALPRLRRSAEAALDYDLLGDRAIFPDG